MGRPVPAVLVGGGSGIVPLMAMLRLARARTGRPRCSLVVSVRGPEDLYFADELPGPETSVVYTRQAPPGDRRGRRAPSGRRPGRTVPAGGHGLSCAARRASPTPPPSCWSGWAWPPTTSESSGSAPPASDPRGLTGDQKVTYLEDVSDDDQVFKALADPTRRLLLDLLFEREGRTLTELESEVDMTRFGVMKHLRVLEDAGLVVTKRSGREKLHFLNPVPIRLIHDRWIDKYTEHHVAALADLEDRTGDDRMTNDDTADRGHHHRPQVFRVYIKASAEQVWEAITSPEWTEQVRLPDPGRVRPAPGWRLPRRTPTSEMLGLRHCPRWPSTARSSRSIRPHRLVQTWRFHFMPEHGGRGLHHHHLGPP